MPLKNVWDNSGVGEAGDFRLAVRRSRDDPARWAMLVDTPLLHLWLDMPDHSVAHQALHFIERTRGKKWAARVDMIVGTFCGRDVRLTKNDEDERYFVELLGPHDGTGTSEGPQVFGGSTGTDSPATGSS